MHGVSIDYRHIYNSTALFTPRSTPVEATFIVFDRHAMADSDSLGSGVGHKLEGALTGDVRGMVGDVNIFLLSEDECEEYGDAAVKLHQAAQPAVDSPCVPAPAVSRWRVAEIMIMIAEPSARRVGLAREAATMMMEWGRRNLDISCYVAKITASNAPSIALFSHKLGFTEAKRVAAFDEVHLVGPILSGPLVDDRDEGYREQAVTHAYEAAPL